MAVAHFLFLSPRENLSQSFVWTLSLIQSKDMVKQSKPQDPMFASQFPPIHVPRMHPYTYIYILKLSTWLVNRTSWCFCYYPIVPQKNATSNLDQIWGSKRLAVKQFVATSRPGGTLGWISKDPLVCMVMVSMAAMEIAKTHMLMVVEADGFERKGPTTSKKCNSFGYPSSHFWCELGG